MPDPYGATGAQDPNALRRGIRLGGELARLANVVISVASEEIVVIAGARLGKLYFEATVNGTLSFAFIQLDGVDAYDIDAPVDVAVTAGTQVGVSFQFSGESYLRIRFVPDSNGEITLADFYQL